MKDFPDFMKSAENHIDNAQQSINKMDGYYYEGADGGQIAFWTYYDSKISKKHIHEFDEHGVYIDDLCEGLCSYLLNDL